MRFKLLFLGITMLFSNLILAQNKQLPTDTLIVSDHSVKIGGKQVNYKAATGTQPVWNEEGQIIASLYHTYYYRTDVKNSATRPLVISFNGGPGSASVWMHLAYTGPKVLRIDDEGYPVQPYGVKDNPHSILDVADIVYVNPVNTGYSRMVAGKDGEMPEREQFFGVNEDIKYLADWINTFVSRHDRWRSPKYIIGESYGGTRVAGLALELQNSEWMYLNGVIMVSPADYLVLRRGGPVAEALNIPYYTAAAWHHGVLEPSLQEKDLLDVLPDSEDFTVNQLIPALAKGGFISDEERLGIAKTMSLYTGISPEVLLKHNLSLPNQFFWKELLRDEGYTIGRLDSRYLGIDKKDSGDAPDYSAELTSWLHSFTPAINYYLQEELGFRTDIKYNVFGPVHPWNNDDDNTRDNLRQAMAQNPYLHVLYQAGYYDGATTYFNTKYSMWQLDPSGKMKDRLSFKGYRSGHMMYLRAEDLEKANNDIRTFIENTTATNKSAKYER